MAKQIGTLGSGEIFWQDPDTGKWHYTSYKKFSEMRERRTKGPLIQSNKEKATDEAAKKRNNTLSKNLARNENSKATQKRIKKNDAEYEREFVKNEKYVLTWKNTRHNKHLTGQQRQTIRNNKWQADQKKLAKKRFDRTPKRNTRGRKEDNRRRKHIERARKKKGYTGTYFLNKLNENKERHGLKGKGKGKKGKGKKRNR